MNSARVSQLPCVTRAATSSDWLEENTTRGAAKVHHLIREPIGFQAARGNAVDEQLKLLAGPALTLPEDDGPLFHWPSKDAMRRILRSFRAVTGLRYDAVPKRALNFIMFIEETCEWPNLCNRIVFIAKAAGAVRPIGLLSAIVREQCKLRRIEAEVWEASTAEGFFWATHARGVEPCVWEQAACSEWSKADGHAVASILLQDPLKAFDHGKYQKSIDAEVRTRFQVRQLKLLLQLYQVTRHVELDCVAGDELRAQRGIVPGCAFAPRSAHPTVSIRVMVDECERGEISILVSSLCEIARGFALRPFFSARRCVLGFLFLLL